MSGPSSARRSFRAVALVCLTTVLVLGCGVNSIFAPYIVGRVGPTFGLAGPALLPAPQFLQLVFANDVTDTTLTVLMAVELQKSDGSRVNLTGFDEFGVTEIFDAGIMIQGNSEISRLEECDVPNRNAIEAIAIGSLNDTTQPGAAVMFPNRAVSKLLPYGLVLRRGVHYNCGQIVRIAVVDDPVEYTEWRIDVNVTCDRPNCGG